MPNSLELQVDIPDDVLDPGMYGPSAVVRLQSSATQSGTYADLTGTGSTPTLTVTTGVSDYEGFDPAGISSTWYRTRYESAGATRVSDWSAPFQTGAADTGLLCSLADVKQRIGVTSTTDDDLTLSLIREVSVAIEGYVGQWLAPRPSDPTATTTLLFDVPWTSSIYIRRGLILDRGNRRTGIRSFTNVGFATTDQPDTGGSYTTASTADILMRPYPSDDGPATRLELVRASTALFYPGRNTVSITGSFGWASVPYDIQGIANRAVIRRFIGKAGGGVAVASGPNGTEILLPDMSGADRAALDRYLVPALA